MQQSVRNYNTCVCIVHMSQQNTADAFLCVNGGFRRPRHSELLIFFLSTRAHMHPLLHTAPAGSGPHARAAPHRTHALTPRFTCARHSARRAFFLTAPIHGSCYDCKKEKNEHSCTSHLWRNEQYEYCTRLCFDDTITQTDVNVSDLRDR